MQHEWDERLYWWKTYQTRGKCRLITSLKLFQSVEAERFLTSIILSNHGSFFLVSYFFYWWHLCKAKKQKKHSGMHLFMMIVTPSHSVIFLIRKSIYPSWYCCECLCEGVTVLESGYVSQVWWLSSWICPWLLFASVVLFSFAIWILANSVFSEITFALVSWISTCEKRLTGVDFDLCIHLSTARVVWGVQYEVTN